MVGKLRNDLTGQKFGFLTVIRRSSNKGNGKKTVVKWECKCKCGKEFSVKNVRRNRIIEFEGKRYTLAEFARANKLSYSALQHRLDRGWSIERIIETPQKKG